MFFPTFGPNFSQIKGMVVIIFNDYSEKMFEISHKWRLKRSQVTPRHCFNTCNGTPKMLFQLLSSISHIFKDMAVIIINDEPKGGP